MCAPVSACTSVCESVCVYSLTILALDFLYLWLFFAAIFLYFSTLLAVTNTFNKDHWAELAYPCSTRNVDRCNMRVLARICALAVRRQYDLTQSHCLYELR